MVLAARCRVCGEVIYYTREEPGVLGDHILVSHPNVSVTHFSCINKDECGKALSVRKQSRQKLFKTTVETWRPGITSMLCSNCGKESTPLIRRQRNKITRTSCGALLILGCWPLCFLPFMLNCCNPATMHLYCPHCSHYLGTYNRKTRTVQRENENANKIASVPDVCIS